MGESGTSTGLHALRAAGELRLRSTQKNNSELTTARFLQGFGSNHRLVERPKGGNAAAFGEETMNTHLGSSTYSVRLRTRINSWAGAAVALLIACMSSALAADADLDTSFNTGVGAGGDFPGVNTIAIQPDGKIVLGGSFTLFNHEPRGHIARVNPDGSLDTSFDPGAGTNGGVEPVILQADGKIVLVGEFTAYDGIERHAIARVDASGVLDGSYNPGIRYSSSTRLFSAALQPDGKLLVGSGAKFTPEGGQLPTLERINPDGSVDGSFTASASVNNGVIYSIVMQPDGKIIVGGFFPSGVRNVFRLNADGSLDASFVAPAIPMAETPCSRWRCSPTGKSFSPVSSKPTAGSLAIVSPA